MKKISPPSVKVPRLNSLLHRLQKNPGPDDEPYLDQLMIFLDDPPEDIANRWKAGAEMCAVWGVATSPTSVWRLYNSHLMEWRVRIALKIEDGEIEPEVLAQKTAHMIGLRTFEMLNNPRTPPATLVGLIRIDLRQKYLELARQKQTHREHTDTERALAGIKILASRDRYAQFALDELKEALSGMPSRFRDRLNEPFQRAYAKALGINPDSVGSPGSVIFGNETPKVP
jgi:hypothetical protein